MAESGTALPALPSELLAVASALEPRTLQQFPPELQHAVQLLALNDVARPVGSGAFTVHLYPSDLDLFERAYGCCGPEDSAEYFATRLQTNARRIALEVGQVYFVELKAGIDTRFQPPSLGHKDHVDIYSIEPATIQQFDPVALMQWVDRMQRIGLLSDAEYDEVTSLTTEARHGTDGAWQKLYDWFRAKWILRWSLKEVLDGFKPLPKDSTMPANSGIPGMLLKDAILQGTLVKMDLLTFSQNRLVAAEAVYDLRAFRSPEQRQAGTPPPQQLTVALGDYATNLRRDVIMYSSSEHFNPLKVAKRIWALAVQEKYSPLIGALSTLFRSDVAAANQVLSDAKELQKAMRQQLQIPVYKLVSCVLTFPKRLANHVAPESQVYDLAVDISGQWFHMMLTQKASKVEDCAFDREQAAELLEPLIKQLQSLVNRFAIQYMQPLIPMLRQLTLSLTSPASSSGSLLMSSLSSGTSGQLALMPPPPPRRQRRPSSQQPAVAVRRRPSRPAAAQPIVTDRPQLMVCSTEPPPSVPTVSAAGRRRRGSTIVMMPESELSPSADTSKCGPRARPAVQILAADEDESMESGEDSEGSLGVSGSR